MNDGEEFITRCPACDTSFRITSQQMHIAAGAVRCGACLRIFQSDEHLVSEATTLSVNEVELVDVDHDSHLSERDQSTDMLKEEVSSEEKTPEEKTPEEKAPEEEPSETEPSETEPSETEPSETEPLEKFESEPDETIADDSLEGVVVEGLAVEGAVIEGIADSETIESNYWQDWEDYLLTMSVWDDSPVNAFQDSQPSSDLANESGVQTTSEPEAAETEAEKPPEPEVADFISSLELDEHPEELVGELKPEFRLHPFWIVSGVLLLVSGALQYAWFNKEIYAQQTEYRPYYMKLCSNLGCVLPEYKNSRLLVAKNLLIRSHPEVESALVVDAILRNSGAYRQEYPDLRLLFRDIENLPVAARLFTPMDYLAGELRGLRYIPANTEVRFSIEILDPGENALGYSLEVLPRGDA